MSFTDRKQFIVTGKEGEALRRVRRRFGCALCPHIFVEGDKARWIYCNSTPGQQTGNFFVCEKCDGTDGDCMARGKASLTQATALAKQWDIYGPDWQREMQRGMRRQEDYP